MRVNVYIADEVMARVDAYCEKNGLRRGAFLTMASTDFLNAKEATPQLKELLGNIHVYPHLFHSFLGDTIITPLRHLVNSFFFNDQ